MFFYAKKSISVFAPRYGRRRKKIWILHEESNPRLSDFASRRSATEDLLSEQAQY